MAKIFVMIRIAKVVLTDITNVKREGALNAMNIEEKVKSTK
jgi:hypothetical protein